MIQIKSKTDCCGCYACAQKCPRQCITMQEDREGFYYPIINYQQCIDCGICETVCPVQHPEKERQPFQILAVRDKTNKSFVENSPTELFHLLSTQVLQENGVVFGASCSSHMAITHTFTKIKQELHRFYITGYNQSCTEDTFRETEKFLLRNRKVLYYGTPCQIAGLKHYLGKEYSKLLTIDFTCHGNPSPKILHLFLRQWLPTLPMPFPHQEAIVDEIYFGEKTATHSIPLFTIRLHSHKTNKSFYYMEPMEKNLFGKGLLSHLFLRPSCYTCPVNRLRSGSDLTITNSRGILLINNPWVRGIFPPGKSEFKTVPWQDVIRTNPALIHSSIQPSGRHAFFRNIELFDMDYLKKHLRPSIKEITTQTLRKIQTLLT